MNAYVLARLARALTRRYRGARVQKVWQDTEGRLILRLRGGGQTVLLLLSAHPDAPGLGIVSERPAAPPRPPALAAYLRAHLEGSQLLGVEPVDYQRILCLHFGGPAGSLELIVEALRPPSLLVVDGEGLLRASSRWEPGTARPLQPAAPYQLPQPPLDRYTPAQLTPEQFAEASTGERSLGQLLLGPTPALCARAQQIMAQEGAEAALGWLCESYRCDGPLEEAEAALAVAGEANETPPDLEEEDYQALALAGRWLLDRLNTRQEEVDARSINRERKRRKKRLMRRRDKIRADMEGLVAPETLRAQADALAAQLGRVKKGDDEIEVEDPLRPGETIFVNLDPRLNSGENLDRLYRKAKKAGRALLAARQRLEETESELSALPDEVLEVQKSHGKAQYSAPFRRYVSSDGWSIWVGRNSRENDRLMREAKPWDLWLHARDGAGAHVVVRKPGRESKLPQATLMEAAGLAALHSRRSDEAVVDVMVVEVSRLRKPKGAGPGRVLVAGERTVRVKPGAGRARPV